MKGLSLRRVLFRSILSACTPLCVFTCGAQVSALLPASPPPQAPVRPRDPPDVPPVTAELPTAPSSLSPQEDVVVAANAAFQTTGDPVPLPGHTIPELWQTNTSQSFYRRVQSRRLLFLSDQRFLTNVFSLPLSSRQKAFVAATDVSDPGNLFVIGASSAIYTATTPRSAYGPGLKGFGRNYGYSLSQDATGEFFGTWLIPSLAHQDPRYHRMPGAPISRRIFHALAHTVVTQHDDGSPMLNYATLLTYPISAEIANLYVPGLHTNAHSTAQRIFIGLASDPSEALIGEFLPDVARRVHIRVTFFQQVINDISAERGN